MSAIQIQALLQPPNLQTSVDRAVSLLNSQFTSLEQLSQTNVLQRLLDDSKAKNESLNSELAASQARIDDLNLDTRSNAHSQLTYAQELSLLRHSLADELNSLSTELVSSMRGSDGAPTLLEEIETLHRNLKELENVKSYVQVVERALSMSEKAVQQVKGSTGKTPLSISSLTEYKGLSEFVDTVRKACENVEDGSRQDIKLVSFLEGTREQAWTGIKSVFTESMLAAAEKLHWPLRVDYAAAPVEDRNAFEDTFSNLLILQDLGERLGRSPEKKGQKDGLYPIQALTQPVSLRFKYHFEGTRQTNRLDKPEWYFAHILNVSHEHHQFMDTVVQHLLQSHSRQPLNAWREFTRLLLPILARKIRRSVPSLIPYPSLLAHTVYQALAFDDSLREAGFGLAATSERPEPDVSADDWQGTSDIILSRKEWFDSWLEGEKRFADDQYNEIISSPEAWHIADDDTGSDDSAADNRRDLRPTNSARRVKALIEQITDRYRPLPRLTHKTKFLVTVQLPVLELYHTRISESLDAYETLSSFLVRAVPGALAGQSGQHLDTKRMTSGVEGTQRLVKALVSAKWIEAAMTNWGEDLFFLELWVTIQEKASLRARAENEPSLPNPNATGEEGTIFEELVNQYSALVERTEGLIVRQVCGEVEADLKAHLYKRVESPDMSETSDDIILSPTLAAPIARISSHLAFLNKTLPQNMVVGLYKQITPPIATYILQRGVLYRGRGRLSARDGKTILDESNLWIETCRMSLGRSVRRVDAPWQKLVDAGRLLSLDSEIFQRIVNSAFIGSDKDLGALMEEVGVAEPSREEIVDIVRLREDAPM